MSSGKFVPASKSKGTSASAVKLICKFLVLDAGRGLDCRSKTAVCTVVGIEGQELACGHKDVKSGLACNE